MVLANVSGMQDDIFSERERRRTRRSRLKIRFPLPKQTGGIHRTKKDYRRKPRSAKVDEYEIETYKR